jgi:hypothetical protein
VGFGEAFLEQETRCEAAAIMGDCEITHVLRIEFQSKEVHVLKPRPTASENTLKKFLVMIHFSCNPQDSVVLFIIISEITQFSMAIIS